MSLVSYENSDSESCDNNSEDEICEQNTGRVIINQNDDDSCKDTLLKTIPEPTQSVTEAAIKENDEILNKAVLIPVKKPKKQPVKISVPTITEFIEEYKEREPTKKNCKHTDRAKGLFALLPPPNMQPKPAKLFVPDSVKRTKSPKVQSKHLKKPKTQKPLSNEDNHELKTLPYTSQVIDIAPEPVKPYTGLDNQAFKELMGANSKRKREIIEIVDIHEDDILSDKEVWMTKSLTDPEFAPKYLVKDPVNDTCKMKHHITYLAQQAKANEQELQNQWAANKYTRQKTQAKYGF